MKINELKLYDSVGAFIRDKLNCHVFTCNEAGRQGIGSVDVFGVRYVNSDKSKIEIIGVEVKLKHRRLSANFGQAKGYSVFCDRAYFASPEGFKEDDKEVANFLGIGLIEMEGEYPNFTCREVLEAPKNVPIRKHRDYVLRYKSIFQCESCKVFYQSKYTIVKAGLTEWTRNEVKNGKGMLEQKEGKETFYCNTCAKKRLKIE